MPLSKFQPCIPTRGKVVPAGREWLHELKMDGYRLIVQRDGDRVRLYTRNGYDWSHRYPWIVESALRNRTKQFVIDGEAVVLGVDGNSNFDALHTGKQDHEVQLYAFDLLALDGDDVRSLPLSTRKTSSHACWRAAPMGYSSPRSSRARSVRTCSAPPATSASKAWYRSAGTDHTAPAAHRIG